MYNFMFLYVLQFHVLFWAYNNWAAVILKFVAKLKVRKVNNMLRFM
jgi:hypothetical protein